MSEKSTQLPHADLYESLGRAVASWQLIERELLRLLITSFSSTHNVALEKMFYSVPNIRDKVNMVNAAVISLIKDEKDLLQWHAIRESIGRKTKKYRNPIVHGHAWVSLISPTSLHGPYIGPPRDPLKSLDAPKDESKDFNAQRLMESAKVFSRLAKRIHDFRIDIVTRDTSP